MGTTERREREREALRMRVVEAARDLLSERGLEGLSMRAIAERVEYSPGTIYLYFRDKDALVREVVEQGFGALGHYFRDAIAALRGDADAAAQHRALGRAYVRFALENTAYFRVMFELPGVARLECPADDATSMMEERSWCYVRDTVQRAIDTGHFQLADAEEGAVIAWGLLHGLTSLYLSGHLAPATTREQFEALVDAAMDSLYRGWRPDGDVDSAPARSTYPCDTPAAVAP